MLKGKKSIYILLPINLCIWGFVGYKIYSYLKGDDLPDMNGMPINYSKMEGGLKSDSIKLSLNYKDPFLKGGSYSPGSGYNSNHIKANPDIIAKVATPSKTTTPTPSRDIKYLGLVKNESKGTATALVSINGKSQVVKPGEAIEGITFLSFNKDEMTAKIGKEKIVIKK